MKLIFGLGNPEPKYSWTRHNVGKEVLNLVAPVVTRNNTWTSHKIGDSLIMQSPEVIFIKPGGYMNVIGQVVAAFVSYYDSSLEDVMVIYDELDLVVGEYKFKQGGGSKIHNGLLSVEQHLSSRDFYHLRVGIRDPEIAMSVQKSGRDPSKYVLAPLPISHKKKVINLTENSLTKEITNWLGTKR